MSYHIKIQTYSGPFDLLLSLVNRQKVDIGAISITEVSNQYLAEVDHLATMDLDVASDFVLVASMLLDIKSASLVPDEQHIHIGDLDEHESDTYAHLSAEGAREILIARLIAYKKFRNASIALGARLESESRMHPCAVGVDPEFLHVIPDYLENVALHDIAALSANLLIICNRALLNAEHVAPERPVSLTTESVDRILRKRLRTTFSELLSTSSTPEEVVVTFLAVLELIRLGTISVRQSKTFDEIVIEHIEGSPAYSKGDSDQEEVWQNNHE